MKAERAIVISRDIACLVVGLGGIVHQQVTGVVSEALLAVYTVMIGIPATVWAFKPREHGNATEEPSQSSARQEQRTES